MIPVTILYDECIDRPKLTEQKNPFDYTVPPPHKWGRNKKEFDIKNLKYKKRKCYKRLQYAVAG